MRVYDMFVANREGTVAFLKSPYGIPIREAWLEAKRVAEENSIEEIVVFDPNGELEKIEG